MVRRDAGAVLSLLLAVAAARKSWGATPHRARSTSTSSGRWRRRRARCAIRSGNLSLARLLPAALCLLLPAARCCKASRESALRAGRCDRAGIPLLTSPVPCVTLFDQPSPGGTGHVLPQR